jgi:diguanylate cyclase (GGDEF)-like protein
LKSAAPANRWIRAPGFAAAHPIETCVTVARRLTKSANPIMAAPRVLPDAVACVSALPKNFTDKITVAGHSELESYTQLMRALLPRMIGVSIFNAAGELHWSNEMPVDEALRLLVAESMRAARDEPGGTGLWITDGEPHYIFWLWRPVGDRTAPFASLLVRCKAGPESENRTLSFVHSLLRPALEILSRELLNREQIVNLSGALAEHDQDLDMLLKVSGSDGSANDDGGDELKVILGAAIEHVNGGLAALIVPEKGLVLVRQQAGHTMDASLVARAHRHLLSSAQMRRDALIVNHMKLQTGDNNNAYRLLACPVARADGRSLGVLALFRSMDMPEFTPRQARLGELLARRASAVIASSYDALTGLLNRPAFEARVHNMLTQDSNAQRWWSALSIDTNRTHVINDTYGMHIGDKVIAQIGELIRKRLPPGSVAARMSGDRFAVLLRASLDDAAPASAMARSPYRSASASRPSSRAPKSSPMPLPLPRPPARPPMIAAAIAWRFFRKPTRALFVALPISTWWLTCAQRSPAGACACTRRCCCHWAAHTCARILNYCCA